MHIYMQTLIMAIIIHGDGDGAELILCWLAFASHREFPLAQTCIYMQTLIMAIIIHGDGDGAELILCWLACASHRGFPLAQTTSNNGAVVAGNLEQTGC